MASQRLWRSDDRGDSWTALSGDLTRGEDRLLRPMMDRVQSIDATWDLMAMSHVRHDHLHRRIAPGRESPVRRHRRRLDPRHRRRRRDLARGWKRPKGVPDHFYVNDLKADRFDRNTVYAVLDGHKFGRLHALPVQEHRRGQVLEIDRRGSARAAHRAGASCRTRSSPELLFLGTEFGVFVTVDGGEQWVKLPGGVPNIPFRDLVIQERENDLVGATFGRGFYVLDDYTPLREISEEACAEPGAAVPDPRRPGGTCPSAVLGWQREGRRRARRTSRRPIRPSAPSSPTT